ncbi:MAG: hypothetical protein KatS3mg115_2335 [Candidatus Poribacteria bacterium]|nr:MAG: hypothetical protein KatS3mg115_2335 [Candidatus Poribacteria bacterium]
MNRRTRAFFALLGALCGGALSAQGVPPHPRLWEGSPSAAELFAQLPPDPIRRNAKLQPDGLEYVLVIRVDFSDQPGVRSRQELDGWLFDRSQRSLAAYYWENSYGQMRVESGPIGGSLPRDDRWYRMPQPMAFYGAGRIDLERYEQLIVDALTLADPDVDFRDYDRNKDGIVDHVIVLHAGNDEATSGRGDDIWSLLVPHVPGLWDGLRVETAMVIAEEPDFPMPHLGVWFHEFFHDFGAPETYVTGTLAAPNDQQYCLMGLFGPFQGGGSRRDGSQPAHICGYLKWDVDGTPENGRTGWVTPLELDASITGLEVPAFARPGDRPPLLKIDIPGRGGKEFFLIENRSGRAGSLFDTALPDEGILIWHVDETKERTIVSVANRLWVEDPGDPFHDNAVQNPLALTADAAYAAEDGQTAFTPATLPSSNANDGTPSGISLVNIGPSGPLMTLDLYFGDLYEPNETIAQARPIAPEQPFYAFLGPEDSRDLYRLQLPAERLVRVDLLLDRNAPIELQLLEESGALLAGGFRSGELALRLEYISRGRERKGVLLIQSEAPLSGTVGYRLTVTVQELVFTTPLRILESRIYPNPAPRSAPLRIELLFDGAGLDRVRAEVYRPDGRLVHQIESLAPAAPLVPIELSPALLQERFSPGVYFLLIQAERGSERLRRLAKFAVR